MRLRPVASLALFAVLLLTNGVHAQVLPPPRAVPQQVQSLMVLPPPHSTMVMPPVGKPVPTLPLAASPVLPPGYQPSAYQVWQNYGWTYNGWIRPRIIQTGDVGYWMYNGAPYPYVYVHPGKQYSTIAPAGVPGN